MSVMSRRRALVALGSAALLPAAWAAAREPIIGGEFDRAVPPWTPLPEPDVVAARIGDVWQPPAPEQQSFGGLFGARLDANARLRLRAVDVEVLVGPFERRDGANGPWIGEHAGKFLSAACATVRLTGDPLLRARADAVARRLVASQGADGYLGTYTLADRWTGWDVWVHKYALIGLLDYHAATGDVGALNACRRVAALLVATFGDAPGQRDIVRAGEHVGMAATSVLEPMCALYRRTGDASHLAFCEYLLRAGERAGGPRIVSSLLEHGRVYRTANSKAYEMLSNLNGMLDLHRVTGEPRLREAVQRAWDDCVRTQLYPSGALSAQERFQPDGPLRVTGSSHVGEGCVTVTWLQLNARLLRLTGEARYAEQIERSVYNALFGAQEAATGDVCYYTPQVGLRRYVRRTLCCVSSVPRGVALLPQLAWGAERDGIAVHQYTAGSARFVVGGQPVRLVATTAYPLDGGARLALRVARPMRFALRLRVPAWAETFAADIDDTRYEGVAGSMLAIEREWRGETRVRVRMGLPARVEPAPVGEGQAVLWRGPQLLAVDRAANPELPSLHRVELRDSAEVPELRSESGANARRAPRYRLDAQVLEPMAAGGTRRIRRSIRLVPFADAGDGVPWIARAGRGATAPAAYSAYASAGLSTFHTPPDVPRPFRRDEYGAEPLVDEDPRSACELEAGEGIVWAWVALDAPRRVTRLAFVHGEVDARGGWFDGSAGPPRVEIVRGEFPLVEGTWLAPEQAQWESLAPFADYPATTASAAPAELGGRRIEVVLPQPIEIAGFRVIGRAGGEFVRIAELSAS